MNYKKDKYSITIGWLYPDLMNTYGDRGNIIVLQKRAEWRGINVRIHEIYVHNSYSIIHNSDLLFMGGAQDQQQEIVSKDLKENKGKALVVQIEKGVPGLYICGAYQFLGKYYKTADGKKLDGLGVFPLYTENPGENHKRLIGNVVVRPETEDLRSKGELIGFENHGGRTYLEDKSMALATVEKGFGNNGEDKTEGIVYKNSFGTYLHGPVLPKNPQLADLLLTLALEQKYGKKVHLEPLDDSIEQKAREKVLIKF